MQLKIKLADNEVELQAVYELRYSIYIQELNKSFIKHDKELRVLKDDFDDSAFHICLFNNDILVGCLRLRYPSVNDAEINRLNIPTEFQSKYKLSVSSRLMLKKEFRNTFAVVALMDYTYDKNIRDGVDFGLIEIENYLVRLYKKFGFHELKKHINDYGLERTIMFVNGRDLDHFTKINSSYSGVFKNMVADMNNEILSLE
jgi:predicted GNAT family N-acyltransferase